MPQEVKHAATISKLQDTLRMCDSSVSLAITLLDQFTESRQIDEESKSYAVWLFKMLFQSLIVANSTLHALFNLFDMDLEKIKRKEPI